MRRGDDREEEEKQEDFSHFLCKFATVLATLPFQKYINIRKQFSIKAQL
jgi:hypothetical protein